jgi:hypothetical protein
MMNLDTDSNILVILFKVRMVVGDAQHVKISVNQSLMFIDAFVVSTVGKWASCGKKRENKGPQNWSPVFFFLLLPQEAHIPQFPHCFELPL